MNTRVTMADGSTKRIKNIQIGDAVLGPDRQPRPVIGISTGRSPLVEVRELTSYTNHVPHDYKGIITFSCSPRQVLYLVTTQHQTEHVKQTGRNYKVCFRDLKRVATTTKVVDSSKSYQKALPNALQDAHTFAQNRIKDPIYWTLNVDRHNVVFAGVLQSTYLLSAATDFQKQHLRQHAVKAGFADAQGMPEKVGYMLGTWIGDGTSQRTYIAVHRKDQDQIARIKEIL